MNLLLFLALSQVVTCNENNYVEITGTPNELNRFYEIYRSHSGQISLSNVKWWDRQDKYYQEDASRGKVIFSTRSQPLLLWRVILHHDCLIWFKISVAPFGGFYVPFKPSVFIITQVLFLAGLVFFVWGKLWPRKRQ